MLVVEGIEAFVETLETDAGEVLGEVVAHVGDDSLSRVNIAFTGAR